MSAMLSLSSTKNTSDLKVNVVNTSNINLKSSGEAEQTTISAPELREVKVEYGENNPYANLSSDDITFLQNENKALKIIIGMMNDNPFYVNKFIVVDDVKLMELVKLLTNADDIQLDADDIGQGCFSHKEYRKVHAIYVIKDGNTKNLKYDYPSIIKELTELGISTKFVW